MEPEELLRDFLSVSGVKIGKIRVDGEFDASSAFKAFCEVLAFCVDAFLQNLQLLAVLQRSASLPSEHPLVRLDKTHADRALEGAFLGWHDTTPTAWMYSFKRQRRTTLQGRRT
mmetsp:Transcript_18099/g.36559  ORF Transcript_18099/g.36559 Transcript_18099/m.36559 type:complete len:114 (-) Transcript_18099:47-388(-)